MSLFFDGLYLNGDGLIGLDEMMKEWYVVALRKRSSSLIFKFMTEGGVGAWTARLWCLV